MDAGSNERFQWRTTKANGVPGSPLNELLIYFAYHPAVLRDATEFGLHTWLHILRKVYLSVCSL